MTATVIGGKGPRQTLSQGGDDRVLMVQFLSGAAVPFLAVGAGLTLAATVEVRSAIDPVHNLIKIRILAGLGLAYVGHTGFLFFRWKSLKFWDSMTYCCPNGVRQCTHAEYST